MATVVRMPSVLAGATEAAIANWLVAPGDTVGVGTPIAEIETEKALVEYAAEEAGVSGYEATIWLGLMAPKGTPQVIVDKLNAAVNEAIKRPDIVKLWADQGAVPMSMTPEAFDKFLRGDIVKWAEVVKQFPERP